MPHTWKTPQVSKQTWPCGYPSTGLDHGAIHLGDDFVRTSVHQIMTSKTWKTTHSSIVLVWDENDYSGYAGGPGSPVGAKGVVLGGGDAPMIVINSTTRPHKTSDKLADHYTLLSTIERLRHLGCPASRTPVRQPPPAPSSSCSTTSTQETIDQTGWWPAKVALPPRLGVLLAVEEASMAQCFEVLVWSLRTDRFSFVVDITE